MAKSYHFLQGTNVVGPLSYDRLSMLVQNGTVSERTMLSDDASNWKPAIELVSQLFARPTANPGTSTGTDSGSGAERWYVQSNGQQYGPISYTELLGWVNSKSVVAETVVRKSENGAWQRADTVFPHLGTRAVAPRTAKPQPEPTPYSSIAIKTSSPTPATSESKPNSETADSGGGAAVTVFILIGVFVVAFAVGKGLVQLQAGFGFFGILAVFLVIRFFMALGKITRNSK